MQGRLLIWLLGLILLSAGPVNIWLNSQLPIVQARAACNKKSSENTIPDNPLTKKCNPSTTCRPCLSPFHGIAELAMTLNLNSPKQSKVYAWFVNHYLTPYYKRIWQPPDIILFS